MHQGVVEQAARRPARAEPGPEQEHKAEEAERAFALLMGSEVAPRRDFIIEGAARLDAEQIDA